MIPAVQLLHPHLMLPPVTEPCGREIINRFDIFWEVVKDEKVDNSSDGNRAVSG